jgi:Fibronectin type III domain
VYLSNYSFYFGNLLYHTSPITQIFKNKSQSDMKRLLLFLGLFLSLSFAQAQTCRTPAAFGAVPLSGGNTAAIIWSGTGATKYALEYKAGSATTATTVIITTSGGTVDSGYYRLTGLTACTPYTYRLRAICAVGDTSAWSRNSEFKTLGCPEPCNAPRGLFAATTDSTAVLSWSAASTGSYQILWKRSTDTDFRTATATTNSLTIRGLAPCTSYQFKVKTICSATQSSGFSEIKTIKTSGCATPCTTPREVKASAQGASIIVTWAGVLPASYQIQYQVGNDTTWRSATSNATIYTLGNVASCTKYTFRVRLMCSATVSTEWSSSVNVTSAGCVSTECNAPRSLSAAGATTSAILKWDTARGVTGRTYDIQYLTVGDTSWRTVPSVRGNVYTLAGLTACKVYVFRVRTNCSATNSSVWSAPMRFETAGCPPPCKTPVALKVTLNDTVAVVTWNGAAASYRVSIVGVDSVSQPRRTFTVTTTSTTITGLARCKAYIVTVTALCEGNRTSESNRYGFETRCASSCMPATGLSAEVTNDTVASLKFNWMPSQAYTIQYRIAGTTAWTSVQSIAATATPLPIRITGLKRCATYEWRVVRVCGIVGSAESRIDAFKTKGCLTCPSVTRATATYRGDSAVVEANTVADGARYILYVQLRGAARVDTFKSATPRFVLRGLTLCQNYALKLVVVCANGVSSEGYSIGYKHGTNCLWDGDIEGFLSATPSTSTFAISPNPGHEAVQVAYKLEQTADVTIQMMNLQGQLINQIQAGNQDAGKYVQTLDGLGDLQIGLYLVVLRSNGKVLSTLKWQKQ